jgi:hypothetical protein
MRLVLECSDEQADELRFDEFAHVWMAVIVSATDWRDRLALRALATLCKRLKNRWFPAGGRLTPTAYSRARFPGDASHSRSS